ncbi:hypothetical protein NM09_05145 [Vibrio caribbeanicus]|uniref:Uncharacterized protein n=3 Tax=Vibrio caribbeanicus TaxID=701175 RepID=A0ACC4P022_9VIBR|nr:hypothetical protein [Vibrio caribbeanicus]KHD26132.1 hypothetical protein NM09_05145 [Vibrio caribbeanicus]
MDKTVAALVGCLLLVGGISQGSARNIEDKIVLSEQDRQALESASTTKAQLAYLLQHFEPILNRDDTLKGVDADENGIRDDVDEFINALMIPENERGFYR